MEDITIDVWGVVTTDTGLIVTLDPPIEEDFDGPGIVVFDETIEVDVWGGVPLYATVTFYKGEQGVSETEIGKQVISVTEGYLDIKPGSFPNSINTKKNGVTAVAILGHVGLDVDDVDVLTLQFGMFDPDYATPKHNLTDEDTLEEHIQDVNFDGYPDLVSHYKTKDTGIGVGDTSAYLKYEEIGSDVIETLDDSIRVIK